MISWVNSRNQILVYQLKINQFKTLINYIYKTKEKNHIIVSVAAEECDKILLPFVIFQNPFSKFGIGQNLPLFLLQEILYLMDF